MTESAPYSQIPDSQVVLNSLKRDRLLKKTPAHIERVVNFVCEHNNIDKSKFNLAPSAKNIEASDDNMSDAELEELIKQMQS